jgi:hypothetical protein
MKPQDFEVGQVIVNSLNTKFSVILKLKHNHHGKLKTVELIEEGITIECLCTEENSEEWKILKP